MQQRIERLRAEPILFAHRGASAHEPENTMTAFKRALEMGATGLESDVWLSKDGIPVLDHDGVVRVNLRNHPISKFMASDLPPHIPTLHDVLAHCQGNYDISLDIKDNDALEMVEQVIGHHDQSLLGKTWLCHPSVEVLAALKSGGSRCKLVNSTRLNKIDEGPERRAARLADHGIDACNMHFSDWTGGLVTLFHRFNISAFGWDMQFETVLTTGLRMGLDAVYSDWVDRMTQAYSANC